MAHVYTLANERSCGKSTGGVQPGRMSARSGYRTLAIDLDQQGNLSAALGADLNELKNVLFALFETARPVSFPVRASPWRLNNN